MTAENATPEIENVDGYVEAITGQGTRRDRSAFASVDSAALLLEQEIADYYIGDGFARRVIEAPAEEMTRAGFDFELLDDAIEEQVKAKLDSLDIQMHLNIALRWSRAFGGSLIVMGINDGGKLDMPLNLDGVKEVEFLRVYDRFEAVIFKRNEDTYSINYGMPEIWQITPAHGGNPYYVHRSRVLVFDGEPLPNRLRFQNQGWGASVLQQCADQLKRIGTSHQWANSLLERIQQAVHKIPGLTQLLRAPDGDKLIAARVDVVDMVRGILNTIVIDAQEDYDIKTQTITGVTDLLDRFSQALSSVSGIPMFILMGQGKGGLSNNQAADLEAWYGKIGAMQNDKLRKPITTITDLVLITLNQAKAKYQLMFCPLYVPSKKEQAETELACAQAKYAIAQERQIYVNMNSLDPVEVREILIEDGNYEIDESLTPEPQDDNSNNEKQTDNTQGETQNA